MKLIFVYNSSLSLGSLASDFMSEILPQRPANCKLCDITYSLVFKKKAWKNYLASLNIASDFYLKDQFKRKFKVEDEGQFPCVYLFDPQQHTLSQLISAEKINQATSLEDLMGLVDQALQQSGIIK